MPTLAQKGRLFTADEYHAMARAGILGEDDRVELIDGKVVAMTPTENAHVRCVNRLTQLFVLRLSKDAKPAALLSVQNPVRLGPHQEPQPDVALLRPLEAGIATPEEVLLIVEVAGTSLSFDRETKVPRYAAAGIPEVWIVALEEEQVEAYRHPAQEGYDDVQRYGRGEALGVSILPGLSPLLAEEMLG